MSSQYVSVNQNSTNPEEDEKEEDETQSKNLRKCKKRYEHTYEEDSDNDREDIKEKDDNGNKDQDEPVYFFKNNKPANRKIFFEMKLKRISNIDTANQTFQCKFHIYFTWLATKEEFYKFKHPKEGESYTPNWTPQFWFGNALGDSQALNKDMMQYKIKTGQDGGFKKKNWTVKNNTIEKEVGFKPWNGVWNRVRYEYDLTFEEEMELESFPFDVQDLSIFIQTEDKMKDCDILPFPRKDQYLQFDPEYTVLAEWDFEHIMCEFSHSSKEASKSRQVYSKVGVFLKVKRRWRAHIYKMLITFCFFLLGMGVFAFELSADSLGDRLGYAITLILADVATMQLLFDELPNVAYPTWFEYYIYACFAYLMVVTIFTFIGGLNDIYGDDDTSAQYYYWIVGCLSVFGLIATHLIFFIWAKYISNEESKKLTMLPSIHRGANKHATHPPPIGIEWDPEKHFGRTSNTNTEIEGNIVGEGVKLKPKQ